jgi:hypothetical protein
VDWRCRILDLFRRGVAEPARLYKQIYCARGDMENRIKEYQLDLFADRIGAATIGANQLRLWFASMAYVLLCSLRRIALMYTQCRRSPRHDPPQAAEDRCQFRSEIDMLLAWPVPAAKQLFVNIYESSTFKLAEKTLRTNSQKLNRLDRLTFSGVANRSY